MTKQIIITLDFNELPNVTRNDLSETARSIMSSLLSEYEINGIKYEIIGCEEDEE